MLHFTAAPVLLALSMSAQGAPGMLLTDFEQGGLSAQGGLPLRWVSVNDGVMGGRSSGSFQVVEGVLRFAGTLDTNGGGFASLRASSAGLDLSGQAGIHLRFRGDGRTYTVRLQQDGDRQRRAASYQAEFATEKRGIDQAWQEVWLPFDAFVPTWRGRQLDLPAIDTSRVNLLGLSIADGIDGDFRLEVDRISTYVPFDLDDLRWHRRPLVVFAPSDQDARLATQLEAIAEARAGFDARALDLIVVLEDGSSKANERTLSTAEVKALRQRFGTPAAAFAVNLVGLDGGTKHTTRLPVALGEIFAWIDAMPMRSRSVPGHPGEPRSGPATVREGSGSSPRW